ncbi:hypothetical protein [Psychroserpens algicola]|uniref:Uncharacterized protein n=1 Tax=Psychroserpens algicola TaxID=1719034 RepID=A0ABT0H718_9FLAO|nr:hypothetical protein [Psychroserpens algicola]MCK8479620.1 hypothetical protein [Psychroserpens algicola]
MNKITFLIAFFMLNVIAFAQTDGINYQAVIIDNNPQEIPGVDIPDNNLPNKPLEVRFTIEDGAGTLVYQETHLTETDPFGMINLMIGQGEITGQSPSVFDQIYWDNPKQLKVEIDLFDGNGLVLFSNQNLTYIPYVRHREIIATSTLDVDGETNLNNSLSVNNQSPTSLSGTLTVDGETNIESDFFVNNQSTTILSGDLYVFGTAFFTDGVFDNLTVNQHSSLNTLTADGVTNINNAFNVNNANLANLTGNLNVDGRTDLNDDLEVDGLTVLNDNLNVENGAPTHLTGTLQVDDSSSLLGPVLIRAEMPLETDFTYDSYPLKVEGSKNGIAIKVTEVSPGRSHNFVSFWDDNGTVVGRIEGFQTLSGVSRDIILSIIDEPDEDEAEEIEDDDNAPPPGVPGVLLQYFNNDYTLGLLFETIDFVEALINFGINLTACILGIGLAGDCDDVVWATVQSFTQGIQLSAYIAYNEINKGAAFESGGADYAEWLKKYDVNEVLTFGDVVGVKGGEVSKSFANAEQFMVVSQNPMVIGAMPSQEDERNYKEIAFLGQIPVKVIGKVSKGDYILPSGNNDGLAMAVNPNDMKALDYKRIVGVAWEASTGDALFSYINTAVGINSNDMSNVINDMQQVMNQMQNALAEVNPNYKPVLFETGKDEVDAPKINQSQSPTLQAMVSSQSDANKNGIELIKSLFENSKNDIMKLENFPYLEDVLNNPTKDNVEAFNNHYTKVLKKLKAITSERK